MTHGTVEQHGTGPSAPPGRRATSAPRSSSPRHRRLRYVYFGLASGWGFVAGTVAVLMGRDALGHSAASGTGLGMRLVIAGVVSLIGGIVVSLAYREAVRRG